MHDISVNKKCKNNCYNFYQFDFHFPHLLVMSKLLDQYLHNNIEPIDSSFFAAWRQ